MNPWLTLLVCLGIGLGAAALVGAITYCILSWPERRNNKCR